MTDLTKMSMGERENIARDPNTAPAVLARLAADRDAAVRGAVAENLNTPPAVLQQLAADDPRQWVRVTASGNPNTLR